MFDPVEQVVGSIGFTEGPVWRANGTLAVTSINRGAVYQIDTCRKAARVLVETGGGPNGLTEADNGTLWIAQNGARAMRSKSNRPTPAGIQRISGEVVEDVVFGLHAPNDCAFGPDGRLWFTDPRGSAIDVVPQPGRVCALDCRALVVDEMIDGPLYPNGLAFDSRGDYLYLAETARRRVLRYRLAGHRPPGQPEVFAEFERGLPDGMAFNATGELLVVLTLEVACVAVLNGEGTCVRSLELEPGCMPTNLCFGDDDFRSLYITVARGGRVMRTRCLTPGLRLLRGG